jgi:hypothetical protein
VPTIVVCSTAFRDLAELTLGPYRELPVELLVIPHPVADRTDSDLDEVADRAVEFLNAWVQRSRSVLES